MMIPMQHWLSYSSTSEIETEIDAEMCRRLFYSSCHQGCVKKEQGLNKIFFSNRDFTHAFIIFRKPLRKTKLVLGREIEHKSLSMQLNLPLLLLNEFSANFQVKLSWTLNFHRDWCAFQFSNTFFKLTSNHHNFNFKFRSVKEKISLFYLCNFWCANWRKITSMLWKKIIITLWNPACYVGKIDQLNSGMIRLGRNKPNLTYSPLNTRVKGERSSSSVCAYSNTIGDDCSNFPTACCVICTLNIIQLRKLWI